MVLEREVRRMFDIGAVLIVAFILLPIVLNALK